MHHPAVQSVPLSMVTIHSECPYSGLPHHSAGADLLRREPDEEEDEEENEDDDNDKEDDDDDATDDGYSE